MPCEPRSHTLVVLVRRPILVTSSDQSSRSPGVWIEARCAVCGVRVLGNNVPA